MPRYGKHKFNITQAAVAKLPAPDKLRAYHYDTKLAGFGVCCWKTGAKVFFLYRTIAGRPRREPLGRFGEVTAKEARQNAIRMAGEIAAGHDPGDTRRKARQGITLGDTWPLYLDKYAKARKRTWKEDERQWKAYFARLKNRRLSSIDRATVRDWHAGVGKNHGHYQANRVLALMSGLFTFAREEGFEGENPCRGLRRFKETSRARFLAADELRELFKSLDAGLPVWRDFFRVLLLTGARIANVRAMRWAELELTRGLWRIPAEKFKTGDPVVVILISAVVDILKARKTAAHNAATTDKPMSEYVFPGRKADYVSYPRAAWKQIVERAGLKDLRPHDLRRTMASWGVAAGASLYAVGKALGHHDAATTAIYARLDLTPIRAAVGLATTAMLEALDEPAESAEPDEADKKS